MHLVEKLCRKVARNRPCRIIDHEGKVYLHRFYIGDIFGWRIYLHRFVGSDPKGLHNHPWKYGFSLILVGWYLEERRHGLYERRFLNFVHGDTMHRVIHRGICWSLFFHSMRCMNWGFLKEDSSNKSILHWVGIWNPDGQSERWKYELKGKDQLLDL